ncbi:MAG: hypothetical protein ACRD0K_05610 [Egibacteraceae bacterium]
MMARDLMAAARVLTSDGDLRLAEPATLRHQLGHAPARVARSGRKVRLQVQHDWPTAPALVTAFRRLWALPRRRWPLPLPAG